MVAEKPLSEMGHDELVAEANGCLVVLDDPSIGGHTRRIAKERYEEINLAARELNRTDKRVIVGTLDIGPRKVVEALTRGN